MLLKKLNKLKYIDKIASQRIVINIHKIKVIPSGDHKDRYHQITNSENMQAFFLHCIDVVVNTYLKKNALFYK